MTDEVRIPFKLLPTTQSKYNNLCWNLERAIGFILNIKRDIESINFKIDRDYEKSIKEPLRSGIFLL